MLDTRHAGLLLHPTSLPGPYGIGDLGPGAWQWLSDVAESGSTLWQVLPLGPTGYGDSPYQCFSSFAGNPNLISPHVLATDGCLPERPAAPPFKSDTVDYGPVIDWKSDLLDAAWTHTAATGALATEFEEFCISEAAWLDDFARFMALKEIHGLRPWPEWAPELRDREPAALAAADARLTDAMERHRFRQFHFFRQWHEIKRRANEHGVAVIGDLPIFAAHDSADVWARRDLFELEPDGRPALVAGVPPDYFSPTGQLWGNPQYRWDRHAAEGYEWWLERLGAVLRLVDWVRIDHFRAFADYWEIPAGSPTAETGRWVDGPGDSFLGAVADRFGDIPIIAEDLGDLSPAVGELRDRFGLPGMKILQFAFDGDPANDFLPHLYPANSVSYTGTHDNDTTLGWWNAATASERSAALDYLGVDGSDIVWDMIGASLHSAAAFSIVPVQDVLALGTTARMNLPGRPDGNWRWRLVEGQLTTEHLARFRRLVDATDR